MQRFKITSIRTKLFTAYSLIFFFVFLTSFLLLYHRFKHSLTENIETELRSANKIISDMVETTTTVAIKNQLRAIAENNLEIVRHIHSRQIRGELTREQARQSAVDILLSQSIGKTGYLYCIDSKGVFRVHPREKVEGVDFSHRRFIQEQIKYKTGLLEYYWKNPNEQQERPKALFMSYFEPWDWIISAASYKEEFFELININDFREKILELQFGRTGYTFVIDLSGNIIVHPEMSGNHYGIEDTRGVPVIKEMISHKSGQFYYWWKNPSEKAARKKYVAYDYLPDFGWIVASTVYAEEVFQPLANIRTLFAYILILSLVFTALVTLVVGSTLLKPLTHLARRFEEGGKDLAVRMEIDRADEIGRLANGFNKFMDTIEESAAKLRREISTRIEKERQLYIFKQVFNNVVEGICIIDEHGVILSVNPAFERISGHMGQEVQGKSLGLIKSDIHNPDFYETMWNRLIEEGQWTGEIWNKRKSGEVFPELLTISSIKKETAASLNYVAVFYDITEIKAKEEQIKHLAYHDSLTDLPNRALLKDRLTQAISTAKRHKQRILVLFIDLDNFKKVNDSIGHAMGDKMLQQCAKRLSAAVRTGDTVARLGGDEFIVMVPDIRSKQEIKAVMGRLQSVFRPPFELADHPFHITASIGITLYPDDGATPDDLLKKADLAMYHSKNSGKNMYHLFESKMEDFAKQKVILENKMRVALENDEFQVYFQPRIDSRSEKVIGLEALVRWIQPDGRVIPPHRFIAIAEESGLIVDLGRQILYKAIVGVQELLETTGKNIKLSANVSPRQFSDEGFRAMVSEVLKKTGFSPSNLELEITESLLMESMDLTTDLFSWLSSENIMLAVDDFGTGYSSLSYLKKLPISVLKIDKSFIDDILTDQDSRTIVGTIILMARKLNLGLVAEGVESEQQLQLIKEMGCHEIQGYLYSPPLPLEKCIDFIGTE